MNYNFETANIALTSKCNLFCKHCGAASRQVEIPLDTLLNLIRKLKIYGVKHIIFSGGEPFCRKDIFSILDYCEKECISFAILTNGTMANAEMLSQLKKYRFLSYVRISVDYTSNEKMVIFRGMYDIMERIIDTLVKLKHLEIPFGIGMTIMDDNISDIRGVARFAKENGAAFFRASPVVSIGRSHGIKHDIDFYVKALFELFDTRKILGIGGNYPFMMLQKNLNKLSKNFLKECPGGIHEISIMSDGSVNRCPLSECYEGINILRMPLENAIDEVVKKCNISVDYEMCSECNDKELCRGGCKVESACRGVPLCLNEILSALSEKCRKEYIGIYGNVLYEEKLRGAYHGCIRSSALWMIPFGGN